MITRDRTSVPPTLAKKFAAHDQVRLGGPYTDEDVDAGIAGLCHAIWVEANVGLSWSLKDYSRKELRLLF